MVKTKVNRNDPTDNTSNRPQSDPRENLERTAVSGEASVTADSKMDAACRRNSAASVSMNRQIRRCKAVRNAWTDPNQKNSRSMHPIACSGVGLAPCGKRQLPQRTSTSSGLDLTQSSFRCQARSVATPTVTDRNRCGTDEWHACANIGIVGAGRGQPRCPPPRHGTGCCELLAPWPPDVAQRVGASQVRGGFPSLSSIRHSRNPTTKLHSRAGARR
jgi:hypothetical protein